MWPAGHALCLPHAFSIISAAQCQCDIISLKWEDVCWKWFTLLWNWLTPEPVKGKAIVGVSAWDCEARLAYGHCIAVSGIEEDIDNRFICRRWDFTVLWTVSLWRSGRNSLPGENLTGSVQTCCRKDVWEGPCYLALVDVVWFEVCCNLSDLQFGLQTGDHNYWIWNIWRKCKQNAIYTMLGEHSSTPSMGWLSYLSGTHCI